jgi:pentalenic acid synthase
VASFALPVPSMVICELLGVPYEDHEFFEEQSRRRLDPAHEDAFGNLHDYLDQLIQNKQRHPGAGLLDDLLASQVFPGHLDRAELVSFALVLLLAGHDTTANMLALGTFALLEHPEQLAAIRADRSLWRPAVEELLRYMTIVNGSPRVATEDIEIAGQMIKAGEGVLLSNGAANHDDALVERPDEFDVHRSARHHLGFGYGIHQCLGQNLARVEMEIAFGTLFDLLPNLRLAVPAHEIPAQQGLLAGVAELPVTW